ncbi:MAG: alpha/beta hydrolase family protein, partial [Arenimonas sp.]
MSVSFARRGLAALAACVGLDAGALNHDLTVQPVAGGAFVVACSNVEQDLQAIAQSDTSPEDFWEGRLNAGQSRYIDQILAAPETAVRFEATSPDSHLYPQTRGRAIAYVAFVCHPTPASNADPDYVLPQSGARVPRMQPRGAAPKLVSAEEYARVLSAPAGAQAATGPARVPLIVFSHGLGGSPISSDYLDALVDLAAYGYVVGATFHGDPRFSRIRLNDIDDYFYLLTDFDKFAEMQLLRPLALSALIDRLLVDPGFAGAIDVGRIGGFGTSLGGQALANLVGARLTTTLTKSCSETARDARVKAVVGLVPYAGQRLLPAFCDDQSGADDVARPYLAISGTADTTAPLHMVRQALNRFSSSRYLVEFEGTGHSYSTDQRGDVFTWMVTFFNAYLDVRADPGAMGRFIRMARVTGGPSDALTIDHHVPFAGAGGETAILEFHNTVIDHYFIAGGADEIAILTHPEQVARGWSLTGHA